MSSVVNMEEYSRATLRLRAAWDNLHHLRQVRENIDRTVEEAEEELRAADANLRQYEIKPGIPKPEYRQESTEGR